MTVATSPLAAVVRAGLTARQKSLPPWLFYDAAGSALFEQITELDEYMLTRTERGILVSAADAIFAAADFPRRITEPGAGSATKTRLLLAAALRQQPQVVYEPVDISPTALEAAALNLVDLSGVRFAPQVADFVASFELAPTADRRLLVYLGSSIGNFDRAASAELLANFRRALQPGDAFLLGVDLVKDLALMLAAYDDLLGVTAEFNRNLLVRLNRELGANFDAASFDHEARWNYAERRIEMHLVSRSAQQVRIPALDEEDEPFTADFSARESIHTENSYKYLPGEAAEMLTAAGFAVAESWQDERGWFQLVLGRVE